MDITVRECNSVSGYIARLGNDTAAYQALRRQIDISIGQLIDNTWKHLPCCPRSKWLNQICSDNNLLPADLSFWCDAVVSADYAMLMFYARNLSRKHGFQHSTYNTQPNSEHNCTQTWLVRPARVVVKFTSIITDAASAGISGFGFLVARNSRNSSL